MEEHLAAGAVAASADCCSIEEGDSLLYSELPTHWHAVVFAAVSEAVVVVVAYSIPMHCLDEEAAAAAVDWNPKQNEEEGGDCCSDFLDSVDRPFLPLPAFRFSWHLYIWNS